LLEKVNYINVRITYNRKAIMKKLLLASASVLTLISACTKEVEVADRAGILQKFSGSDDEVQDIGIERLTTTLPQQLGGRTIVANVMREGISEELPEGFIEEYSYGIAEDILDGDAIEYLDGEGFFIDGDAVDNNGAIYVSGTGEDMVGVGIIVGMEAEDSLMIIAAGTEVSAMPTTGKYDYEGANFAIEFSEDEDEDDIDVYIGSFNAGVNFGTGEGLINLEFDNNIAYIDGDFTVDTATGIFVGDELEMNSIGGTLGTATIHGNFHGEGASGMTGIYTNNIAEPDFIGAIAGHQQDSPPPVLLD
jgi:hypothetical protein